MQTWKTPVLPIRKNRVPVFRYLRYRYYQYETYRQTQPKVAIDTQTAQSVSELKAFARECAAGVAAELGSAEGGGSDLDFPAGGELHPAHRGLNFNRATEFHDLQGNYRILVHEYRNLQKLLSF